MNEAVKAYDPNSTWDVWMRLVSSHGSPKAESPISTGYWRLVSSKGHARAVATWFEDGSWQIARIGVDHIDSVDDKAKFLRFMSDVWPTLEAWSNEDFDTACERGVWPDQVPVRPKDLPATPEIANPSLGQNFQPADDSKLAELIDKLDALVGEATKLAKSGEARTQEQADTASNLKARIRDLRQQIVAAHKAVKAPILAEGKRIDGAYFQPRDKADALERRLHEVVIRPFLLEQEKRKIEAAKAAKEAAAAGQPEPEPIRTNAGAKGRVTSLRTRYIGEITDYEAFVEEVKAHDEVRTFMAEYAMRIAPNIHQIQATVNGLKITETKV